MRVRARIDTKAIDKAISDFEQEIEKTMHNVGKRAVDYAIEHGEYHDVTGRLRQSNDYKVSDKKLTIMNTAPYAEEVQNRGLDVIGGAVLFDQYELDKQAHR